MAADKEDQADQTDETIKANACQRKCCPAPSLKNPEVLGFMWDRIGATVLFITILTVLPGLTVLARREGGCYKYDCPYANDDDDDLCNFMGGDRERGLWYCKAGDVRHPQDKECAKDPDCKVYGLSPSSTIPFVATVSGLCCAVLMPLVGAFVDHSPKRWEALVATAALLIAANALQISLGPRTWFAAGLIQATVGAGSYMAHQACLFAYIPEMVDDPSEVPSVTGVLKAWESLAIILYLVIVGAGVGPLFTREGPSGEVDLARVGQVVAVVVGAPLMVLGMFRYLGRRPALQELPEGRSLWTIGFYRVAATVKTLRTEFRTLGCFYTGYAFWESANTAVVSLTGAYVLEQLGMDAGDFIIIALLFVLCAIPGAITSIKIADKEWLSLKASVAGALVLSSVCLCCVCAFVYSPSSAPYVFAIVPFLGFANGWIYPAQRNLLVALIPGGCEAEMYAFGVLRGDTPSTRDSRAGWASSSSPRCRSRGPPRWSSSPWVRRRATTAWRFSSARSSGSAGWRFSTSASTSTRASRRSRRHSTSASKAAATPRPPPPPRRRRRRPDHNFQFIAFHRFAPRTSGKFQYNF